LAITLGSVPVRAAFAQSAFSRAGEEISSDFKYLVNNVTDDAIDVVTSPLHVGEAGQIVSSPRFYLVVGGAGALWGGSFALDQTMRSHLHDMSSSTASMLQDISYGSVGAAVGLLYGYGLYVDDPRARQYALTAGEGAGIATLLNVGIKDAFGRLRPSQDHHDHDAFFHGGQSFTSGDVTPMFALACGVSEYYDNRWYVAIPAYSLALLDGFGRMGHDAHWFSDVVGAAVLGVATTELFIYRQRKHDENPNSFKVFAVSAPVVNASMSGAPTGLGIAFSW
jgi:hypothetical protein